MASASPNWPRQNFTTIAHENLGEVLKAGKRAKELVHQILAFSRQSTPECKSVSVKCIIEEAAILLRSSLPATIEIRHKLDSDGFVTADPSQLHQVVMNLCTNAAHAMRENGGVLELALEFYLVLTDMTMPKITGDLLARQMMAIQPQLPIILCSGFSHNMDESKAAAMGIRAYLRKPILKGQMARIIRDILEKRTRAAPLREGT